MRTLICRPIVGLSALGLSLIAASCKDDAPSKLFDESGVWSVVDFNLEGSGQYDSILNSARKDAFMLSFDSSQRVVTTAACVEPANNTPANSPCLISVSTTVWECRCFSYDFVEDEMYWREFEAGQEPPRVSINDAEPETADGTDTGDVDEDPFIDALVTVSAVQDIDSTYILRPLPIEVFGSDGMLSSYIFQPRANSVFARAYEDPQRATCTPCIP